MIEQAAASVVVQSGEAGWLIPVGYSVNQEHSIPGQVGRPQLQE
jgi:hypothetical protein